MFSDCFMHQNFMYFVQNWIWWWKLLNCSQVFFEKASLMNFVGKNLWGSHFFNEISYLQSKERLPHRCFPVGFTKYFRTLFLQNTSGWLLLLITFICSFTSTSATKNISFDLGYFKYFWDKHSELLANSSLWRF